MDKNNTKATELWTTKWSPETHTTEYAKKRIKSAQSAKLTPIKVDANDMFGYFQGSHGKYETFLDYCPCGDFIRSKLPCKHIYRLAIELGVLDTPADSNINAILTPKNERASIDGTIDIIENISDNAQRTLLNISASINANNPNYLISLCEDVEELLNSGIIVNTFPEKYVINFGKKSDITDFLDGENVSYPRSAKKNVLEEICLQAVPKKAEAKFGKSIYVGIPTRFSIRNIHYYLHRKYDVELVYDDNSQVQTKPLLETNLPDDDVTEQLIQRGYYKPGGMLD